MFQTNNQKIQSYRYGIFAETVVCFYLFLKGYRIVERRYKNKLGEVDIICIKKNLIAAVEVKARKNAESSEVLTANQRKRIVRAMRMYANSNKIHNNYNIRFDLVIYYGLFSINHIKNAWDENY